MNVLGTCENCGLPITDPYACTFKGMRAVRHEPVEACFTHVRAALKTRDDEIVRVKRERDDARSRAQRLQHAYDTMLEERDRLRDEARNVAQTKPQERTEDGTTRTWDALPTFDWKVVVDPIRRWDARKDAEVIDEVKSTDELRKAWYDACARTWKNAPIGSYWHSVTSGWPSRRVDLPNDSTETKKE